METDILLFFDSHPDALPLYARLEECIRTQLPDVFVKIAKTQITFQNRHGFAFVSFLPCCRAAERPQVWLTLTFGMDHPLTHSRIDTVVEPYPGRFTHHMLLSQEEEIDKELLGWLIEAAAFAASKKTNRR